MRRIWLACLLTLFASAAWAESCPTPAVKQGRKLDGHAKRVFIKECCERMAAGRGGSFEEQRRFIGTCQKASRARHHSH
jgi:hypothetical protein